MSSMEELSAKLHGNRTLLLIIVFLAFFLDLMITTSIVTVAPSYLFVLWNQNFTASATAAVTANSSLLNQSVLDDALEQQRQRLLNEQNYYVSIMFASKSLVQILADPFVGILCDRIGVSLPMLSGFVVTFLSTAAFAFSKSYTTLFIARAFQGVGSSCLRTPGLDMLAAAYPDDKERGVAISRAIGGIAMGVLLGPVYGGVLYEWQGIELPYLLLAGLAILDGLFLLIVVRPKVERPAAAVDGQHPTRLTELLRDPHICVVAGSLTVSNAGLALIQSSIMIYMIQRWNSSPTVQGLIYVPASALYLIATQLFGRYASTLGRWLTAMIGHVFFGLSMIAIPFLPTPVWFMMPMAALGFSIGLCDVSNFAEMPHIVDLRHTPNAYGTVSALSNIVVNVAYFAGPMIGGPLISAISFKMVIFGMAAITTLYAPMLYLNKCIIRANEEKMRVSF